MSFSFVDYRLIESSVTSGNLASGVIQNLGMANRLVSRIITVLPPDSTANNELTLLGQYQALSPDVTAATGAQAATTRYNVRYNDRFEFTADIDNPARLMSVFTESEGVPFVTRQSWSDQGVVTGGYTDRYNIDRYAQSELEGTFFFLGTKLTNGRVGQRGIEVHLTATVSNVDLFRSYCEYMRVARLSNGYLDVFNA